ncbi:MAG: hypothetical protein ABEL76_13190 [Bradymonadaceae bacterium]
MSSHVSIDRLVRGGAKVAVTGLVTAAIFAGFLALSPDGDVRRAQSDIWDMRPFERTETEQFARALEKLGHPPPRVFDWNGNKTFLSVRKTDREPREVLRRYQRMFARRGLNDRAYEPMSMPDALRRAGASTGDLSPSLRRRVRERSEALLTGEIVPQSVSDDRVRMGGGVLQGSPDDAADLNRLFDGFTASEVRAQLQPLREAVEKCGGFDSYDNPLERSPSSVPASARGPQTCRMDPSRQRARQLEELHRVTHNILQEREKFAECEAFQRAVGRTGLERMERRFAEDLFGTFRSIEAFRNPSNDMTTVAAVWGDKTFDVTRAARRQSFSKPVPADDTVPACPTCRHQLRFAGPASSDEVRQVANIYSSEQRPAALRRHYVRELRARGWRKAESTETLERVLRFAERDPPDRSLVEFRRGDRHLVLSLQRKPSEGRTYLTTVETK